MTYITRIANERILAKYFLYSLKINRPYSLNVLVNAHSRSGRKWQIFLTSGQLYISAVRR